MQPPTVLSSVSISAVLLLMLKPGIDSSLSSVPPLRKGGKKEKKKEKKCQAKRTTKALQSRDLNKYFRQNQQIFQHFCCSYGSFLGWYAANSVRVQFFFLLLVFF